MTQQELTTAREHRDEIVAYIAGQLYALDAENCAIHGMKTDVYLYINDDGTITLDTYDTFGNTWKNDSHYCVTRIEHSSARTWADYFETIGEISDACEIAAPILIDDAASYEEKDRDEITTADVLNMIDGSREYIEAAGKLRDLYQRELMWYCDKEYVEQARARFDDWIDLEEKTVDD